MTPDITLLASLLLTPVAQAGFSDADVAVLVRQALVSDARQLGLSSDALGRSANRRPDLDVAKDVRQVLAARVGQYLKGLNVSCRGGQVILRGRANDEQVAAQAEALAGAIPGARAVSNQITTPGADAATTAAPVPDTGPARTEPFVFLTWEGLAAAHVVVHVDNGVVELRGTASSQQARDYATAAARLVPGARSVNNRMELRAGSAQDDDRLTRLISRRFEWSVDLQPHLDSLAVSVKDGVARLEGTLVSESLRELAVSLAQSTRGILLVDDRLQVAR